MVKNLCPLRTLPYICGHTPQCPPTPAERAVTDHSYTIPGAYVCRASCRRVRVKKVAEVEVQASRATSLMGDLKRVVPEVELQMGPLLKVNHLLSYILCSSLPPILPQQVLRHTMCQQRLPMSSRSTCCFFFRSDSHCRFFPASINHVRDPEPDL